MGGKREDKGWQQTNVILQIDDNYRVATDEYNFILQRKMDPEKNPRKGKKANTSTEKWKNIGYWGDLSQLLASYTRQVLRTEIGETPPSRPYLGISELSRKLSSGLEDAARPSGGKLKSGEIYKQENPLLSLG